MSADALYCCSTNQGLVLFISFFALNHTCTFVKRREISQFIWFQGENAVIVKPKRDNFLEKSLCCLEQGIKLIKLC